MKFKSKIIQLLERGVEFGAFYDLEGVEIWVYGAPKFGNAVKFEIDGKFMLSAVKFDGRWIFWGFTEDSQIYIRQQGLELANDWSFLDPDLNWIAPSGEVHYWHIARNNGVPVFVAEYWDEDYDGRGFLSSLSVISAEVKPLLELWDVEVRPADSDIIKVWKQERPYLDGINSIDSLSPIK